MTTVLAAIWIVTCFARPLSGRSVTTTSASVLPMFANVTRPARCGNVGGSPGQNHTPLVCEMAAAIGAAFGSGAGGALEARPATSAPATNTPSRSTKRNRRDVTPCPP